MNTNATGLIKVIATGFLMLSSILQVSSVLGSQLASSPHPPLQNHQSIIDTAQQFLKSNIDETQYTRVSVQMSRLDPRLRLTQCSMPLTSTLSAGSRFAGKTTVHIRCNSDKPWTVFVGAQIKLYGNVVETSGPLTKDHILRKDDLILVEKDLSRLKYGYFTQMDYLIGKQLKRHLPQNRPVKANYVKSPTLIKRGELVSIVAENTGYSVKMTGTALSNGARGDRIRVKNISSRRIIEGVVKEAGVVNIN